MARTHRSIRLDISLADQAVKVFGVKSRTEAVHMALREIVAMKRSGICLPRMIAAKAGPQLSQWEKM